MLKQEESIFGELRAMKGETPTYVKSILIVIETLI